MTPTVDLLVIVHNNRSQIPTLMESLRQLALPGTAYFLDNDSRDGTPEALIEVIPTLPFPGHLVRSGRNNGFARGMNLLARLSNADFLFLLNPDTELEPGCLGRLLERISAEPQAAICEARQSPREHPKAYDPQSGETTWCSGAAALIRREAFELVGGFDERLFFMYCEDIDLSWRLWLSGWKCLYAPEAVVQHFTQDLTPGKRRTLENYYSFRNTLFLFHRFGRYGAAKDRRLLWNFLRNRFVSSKYSVRSKALFTIALLDHIRYIPYLLQSRDSWHDRTHHWVRLEETSLSH